MSEIKKLIEFTEDEVMLMKMALHRYYSYDLDRFLPPHRKVTDFMFIKQQKDMLYGPLHEKLQLPFKDSK